MKHTIRQGGMSAVIDTYGAQLRSLRYREHEYLWQGDPAYWEEQSPLLFPFVGRFTEGRYTLRGESFPMSIHGFAKLSEFDAVDVSEASITFELRDNEATRAVYPCAFHLAVTYVLRDNGLDVSYRVTNPADPLHPLTPADPSNTRNPSGEPIWFGIGGHPGFQVPLEEDLAFGDYYLDFTPAHQPSQVGHTKACFLSGIDTPFPLEEGHVLRLHHDMFDEDAIVLKNVADTVTLRSDRGTRSVTLRSFHLPYLGLWHAPRTDAPYICIEPWTSLPSRQDIVEEFTCKSDLICLFPGEIFRAGWAVDLT